MRRTRDWLKQSRKDFSHAQISMNNGDYEWACFAAHQAGEKAVKALLQSQGIDAWGHSISHLIAQVSADIEIPDSVLNKAKRLDRHYIPPRYPDSYPEGAPMDYYTIDDAKEALIAAGEVIHFAEEHIDAPSADPQTP